MIATDTEAEIGAEVCKDYLVLPLLACIKLWKIREDWSGTRAAFIQRAEELTGLEQAHVYRLLRLRRFIPELGDLPADQQPSWRHLTKLGRIRNKEKLRDAWIAAIWSNGGVVLGMTPKLLRESIRVVMAQSLVTR